MTLADVPDGLSSLQYAMRICDDLGIPGRGNIQMIGEAIEAVSKSRLFRGRDDATKVSYYWLSRRVMVAREQGAKVTPLWFCNGEYWNVEKPEGGSRSEFTACEKDGCVDGWVRTFAGKTAAGHPVDPKIGAVLHCQCWHEWSGR